MPSSKRQTRKRHGRQGKPETADGGLCQDYAQKWAVVVGINRYQYLGELKYAVADAIGMANVLKEEFGFDQVHTFYDEQATRDDIRKALAKRLPDETKDDDCVVIFFAGHGEKRTLPNGETTGYLAPVNAELGQWHTYIHIPELLEAAKMCAAKHILFILDSCYSGFATTRAAPKKTKLFNRTMLQSRARQVLTAGLDKQVVDDNGPNGHSHFTYHLIEGLKADAPRHPEGIVTAMDLMVHVRAEVVKATTSAQTPDYGLLAGHESGGDFVFFIRELPGAPSFRQSAEEKLAEKLRQLPEPIRTEILGYSNDFLATLMEMKDAPESPKLKLLEQFVEGLIRSRQQEILNLQLSEQTLSVSAPPPLHGVGDPLDFASERGDWPHLPPDK